MELNFVNDEVFKIEKFLVDKRLQQIGMVFCKPQFGPMRPDQHLNTNTSSISKDEMDPYRSHMGGLLNLATKLRADLCLAPCRTCSHVSDPKEAQTNHMVRAPRYLRGGIVRSSNLS